MLPRRIDRCHTHSRRSKYIHLDVINCRINVVPVLPLRHRDLPGGHVWEWWRDDAPVLQYLSDATAKHHFSRLQNEIRQ